MPWKPPRPCRYHGCPNVTRHTSGYCEFHKRFRRPSDYRPSAAKRGYDKQWQQIRAAYISRYPICQTCHNRPSQDVHHVNGNNKDNRTENLIALCHSCHSSITGRTVGGFV